MGSPCGKAPPQGAGSECVLDPGHGGPHRDTEGIEWATIDPDDVRVISDELVRDTLVANGFVELRKSALAIVAGVGPFEVELLDVMLAYLDRKRASADLRDATNGATIGDAMDLDRWRLEALRRFRVELDEVERRWQARQELRK